MYPLLTFNWRIGSSAGKESASLQCKRSQFDPWVWKICWRRNRLPTPVFSDFSCGSHGKESTCNAGDPGLIPGSGRSTGEGIGYPLQYSWASLVAQLVKNLPAMWETWVWSLGWKDPWRRERLPSPVFWPGEFHWPYSPWGRRVGHDWATFTFTYRRKRVWRHR